MDEVLEAWRNHLLGEMVYLYLDARYEKVRMNGQLRDAAVLIASGVGRDGKRRILGVSVSLSEAEQHWRLFMESLVERGLHSVQLIISDDHYGLRKARQAVFTGVPCSGVNSICSRMPASMSLASGCRLRWQLTSGRSLMHLTELMPNST